MKRILLSVAVLSAVGLSAQSKAPAVKTSKAVGIQTNEPRATLDVNGNARFQKLELMETSAPTQEVYSDCPCVLTVDKFGVVKRIPQSKFVFSDGSSGGSASQGGGSGSNNQSSGGANLGTGVQATINDQEDYVVSFIYNGYQLQGKIDNDANKVVVDIPYTNGNGAQYNTATSTTTTNVATSQDGQSSPITLTIKAGTLTSGNGALKAEITTPALYNVKKLAPGKVETIAEFNYTLNNVTRKIVLKVVGGVPDKQFADAAHKFIYIPVTVKIGSYNKVWLSQNLGADYAKVDGNYFNPKKVGGDAKDDYKAYGSLFQWGRVDNSGYELVHWTSSTSGTPVNPNATWKTDSQLTSYNDPCPNGYHTPTMSEWQDFHQAVAGSRTSVSNNKIWKDTNLNLPAAGFRNDSDGSSFGDQSYYGLYWSSTELNSSSARRLYFYSSGSNPQDRDSRSYGFSVRCLKD